MCNLCDKVIAAKVVVSPHINRTGCLDSLLTVRDTGTGITNQDLPRIFDHFYRGRQSQEEEGAGLGLTIVQQLLLYCGGQIRVESQVGQGSQFHVQLPLYQGEA